MTVYPGAGQGESIEGVPSSDGEGVGTDIRACDSGEAEFPVAEEVTHRALEKKVVQGKGKAKENGKRG